MTRVCAVLALLLCGAIPASAQTGPTLSLGANISSKIGAEPGTAGRVGPGLLWHLGSGHDGWGATGGLGWYWADLRQPLASTPLTDFGVLRVRPVMVGASYTKHLLHLSLTGALLGGYAFNAFTLRPSFSQAYRNAVAGGVVERTRVSDSLVLKPDVSSWFTITRRVGLEVGLSYTATRPTVTLTTDGGIDTRHIRADVVAVRAGLGFRVY